MGPTVCDPCPDLHANDFSIYYTAVCVVCCLPAEAARACIRERGCSTEVCCMCTNNFTILGQQWSEVLLLTQQNLIKH